MPFLIWGFRKNLSHIIVIIITIASLFYLKTSIILACTCKTWDCQTTILDNGGWYKDCTCIENETCTQGCNPGYYACNQSGGGCCPIGDEPPSGGGDNTSGPSCTATTPTGLSATRTSGTSATLNWTPGTPGGSAPYQALWVSTNSDPFAGCAGSSGGTSVCPVRHDYNTNPLDSDQNTYDIDGLLTPGTVYYWQVMNFQDSSCYRSGLSTHVSSCDLSSSSITLKQGYSQTISSTIASSTGIDHVTFSSNPTYLTVGTGSDSSYVYQTLITGASPGSTTLSSGVYITSGALACTASSPVTVTPPQAWWQVKDSDITSSGDISSDVPIGSYFELEGPGGYPGVPASGGTTSFDASNVSANGWWAASTQTNAKVYDNAYFNNQIPKDTVITTISDNNIDGSILTSGGTASYGYYWYKYDGAATGLDLTINAPIDLGSRKVILLVNSANLYINGAINLTDGQGFFMTSVGKTATLAKGNIYVNATVGSSAYDLEGIYEADGVFDTGISALPLSVRGAVTGYGGITMTRDLGGSANSNPAEFFEYAPDQVMLYPSRLGSRKINWKEVAP